MQYLWISISSLLLKKRGLPHAHILIILQENSKPNDPQRIDEIVCAEIPSERDYPALNEIVKMCMLHKPCGIANPNRPACKIVNVKKNFRNNTKIKRRLVKVIHCRSDVMLKQC